MNLLTRSKTPKPPPPWTTQKLSKSHKRHQNSFENPSRTFQTPSLHPTNWTILDHFKESREGRRISDPVSQKKRINVLLQRFCDFLVFFLRKFPFNGFSLTILTPLPKPSPPVPLVCGNGRSAAAAAEDGRRRGLAAEASRRAAGQRASGRGSKNAKPSGKIRDF